MRSSLFEFILQLMLLGCENPLRFVIFRKASTRHPVQVKKSILSAIHIIPVPHFR